jgi:RNA methyltransferase, TrmH family
MTVQRLTSKNNPLLKTIRLIASGSRRAPKSLVVAEGVRVLEEALRAECPIQAVVCSEHFGGSAREQRLLKAWESRNVRRFIVSESLFESLSSVETPQGALALVSVLKTSLADIRPDSNALILYACGIQDPGNFGTLLRTAAAANVAIVCTSKGTVSARSSKSIRSSAGAFFHLPPVEHVDAAEFLRYCAHHSIRLYRTDIAGGLRYTQANLRSACAIVLGSESGGIAQEEFAQYPSICIPMANGIESLNVATAGAIILFEASRQRSAWEETQ